MWKNTRPPRIVLRILQQYAHVSLQLTDKDTYFALTQADTFTVFLSYKDLKRRESIFSFRAAECRIEVSWKKSGESKTTISIFTK